MENIKISRKEFDEFIVTLASLGEDNRKSAGSALVDYLDATSRNPTLELGTYVSKAVGTQLVKHDAYVENSATGWAKRGRGFQKVDDIRKELEPGFYAAIETLAGPFLIPFSVTNDDILDLPGEKTANILTAIYDFYDKSDTFKALNFLHKRGMILKGQPGTGKSVIAFKAGRELIQKHGGIVMYATDPYAMDSNLQDIRSVQPDTKILNVIEDIDMMVAMYGERKLTAVLDGESSVDGIFTLAITNDDRILSARITSRPSRFDIIETVGVMSKEARISFLQQKATSLTPEQIQVWADKTEDFTVPMLKELMIMVLAYTYPLEESLSRIKKTFMSKFVDSE